MKRYGVPRLCFLEFMDVADLKEIGCASHCGHLPGKGGEYHSYFRNPEDKARVRRRWKRKARQEGKDLCREIDE